MEDKYSGVEEGEGYDPLNYSDNSDLQVNFFCQVKNIVIEYILNVFIFLWEISNTALCQQSTCSSLLLTLKYSFYMF